MKQPLLPPSILAVFLLSLAYWIYLASFTRMDISCDAIGYRDLGRLLQNHGFIAYFKTGPNREPLYPLLVMLSMCLENLTGIGYTKIMAIFGVIITFLTQALTYKILRLLNIRNGICILILAYLALSPALNNSAFSLYSEIATYPIILGIILASAGAWDAMVQNKRQQAFLYGGLLGTLLTAATLVKAAFEGITPAYLIAFFTMVLLRRVKLVTLLLCLVAATSFYYVPITGYKYLNCQYNGNFVITDRGPWFLYGNTARRMEPLTFKRFTEALVFVPGEGVCNGLFGQKECYFWTFQKADELGTKKFDELNKQHLSTTKIDSTLLGLSTQKALQNPFQYILLTFIEGSKIFFWESTKVGFVDYPHWLQKIYDTKIFNNGLRFFASFISFISVLSIWQQAKRPQKSPISFLVGVLIFLYTLFFSFFFILDRYALPIVPLYFISIGLWLNQNLAPKKIS